MSGLHEGDGGMHYCDGSHRWAGVPDGMDLYAWRALIREHMVEHLATMGGPPGSEDDPHRPPRTVWPLHGWPTHPRPNDHRRRRAA